MKSSELRETLAAMSAEVKQIVNAADSEKRSLTEPEESRFSELETQIVKTKSDLAVSEKREWSEALDAELKASSGRKVTPTPTASIRSSRKSEVNDGAVLQAWTLFGSNKSRNDSDMMFAASERGIDLHADAVSFRDLNATTNTQGEYTIPTGFVPKLVEKLKYYCNFRNFAELMTTPNGIDLPMPTVDNTSNEAEAYTEVAQVDEDGADDPVFGQVTMKRFRRSSRILKVSTDLLANTAINDFPGLLAGYLGEQLGRKQSSDMGSTNAGSSAPEGFFRSLTVGNQLAANVLTWQKLVDLQFSLDQAYIDLPSVGWVMHPLTWAAVRKLADDNNRPLYLESLASGAPGGRVLEGKPVYLCTSMASISSPASNVPLVVYGKLDDYKIRDIPSESSIIRYNELFRRTGQIGLQVEAWYDARWATKAGVVTLNSTT